MLAYGVNADGYREILGLKLGDSESEASWSEFFSWLKIRDLRGVDLIVSDHHGGLVRAIRTHFQGVTWQRCQTHFMRNILDATPKTLQEELYPRVRAILDAPDMDTARMLLQQVLEAYEAKAPKAMSILEAGFEDATAVLMFPERYRKRLRTTNGMERLNEEIRRRERVIRIFPNRESVVRLIGALLMEIDEKRTSGKKYLEMTEYLEWQQTQVQERKTAPAYPARPNLWASKGSASPISTSEPSPTKVQEEATSPVGTDKITPPSRPPAPTGRPWRRSP
jgi:transposase-like protein